MFPVEHALLLHVGAALSPLSWLTLEANFPVAVFEDGAPDPRGTPQSVPAGSAHIGDLRLGVMPRLLDGDLIDVGLGMRFWLPTGRRSAYLGGDNAFARWEIVPSVAGEVDLLRYGCTVGVSPMFFAGRDGDRLALSCAAQFKLAPLIAIGIEPHVAAFAFLDDKRAPQDVRGLDDATISVQFEPLATVAVTFGEFRVILAGGPGVGGAPGTPTARAALSLSFTAGDTPKEIEEASDGVGRDADFDGIPDAVDACPDRAGSQKRDGCPEERDADGDGIDRSEDACPDTPGPRSNHRGANGCPDGDGDGVADAIDKCPIEPGDRRRGCPRFAQLQGRVFVVRPALAFQPGRASLPARGLAALVDVSRTLRANPDLKVLSVTVSTKDADARITQGRVDFIRKLLLNQRIAADRIDIDGSASLPAGRVELRITE